jgi:hypothetical protein
MTKEEEAKKKQGEAPRVTLFSDCNFAGKMADVSIGEYASMAKAGFDNDVLSSMKIPAGLKVQVFEHDNFKGPSATFTMDVTCFRASRSSRNWNDRVSSLKISKA